MSNFTPDPLRAMRSKISTRAFPVYGFLFLVIGSVIAAYGLSRLYELLKTAQTVFPLGSAEQTLERIGAYWPTVFTFFVGFIASVSALLFGAVWSLGAVVDIYRYWRTDQPGGALNSPEDVASRLFPYPQSAFGKKGASGVDRFLSGGVSYSPVSKLLMKSAFVSLLKILLVWGLVWSMIVLIQMAPGLLQKFLAIQINLRIPSFQAIHLLFAAAIGLNILTAVFLLSRKGDTSRGPEEEVLIKGNFAPSFFLSVFENAFSLLSPRGLKSGVSFKLRNRHVKSVIASLVESHPKMIPWLGVPLGYLLAPCSAFCTIWGYTCLMAFGPAKASPVTPNFISESLPLLITDIFFYIGLIWLGMYFADRIRILVGVRRFESTVALCALKPASGNDNHLLGSGKDNRITRHWDLEEGSGDELISWAKSSGQDSEFMVILSWRKLTSESLGDSASRYIFKLENDPISDSLVHKVFELTQNISFKKILKEDEGGSLKKD